MSQWSNLKIQSIDYWQVGWYCWYCWSIWSCIRHIDTPDGRRRTGWYGGWSYWFSKWPVGQTLNWNHVGFFLCLSLSFSVLHSGSVYTVSLYLFFWALRSFLNHYIDLWNESYQLWLLNIHANIRCFQSNRLAHLPKSHFVGGGFNETSFNQTHFYMCWLA